MMKAIETCGCGVHQWIHHFPENLVSFVIFIRKHRSKNRVLCEKNPKVMIQQIFVYEPKKKEDGNSHPRFETGMGRKYKTNGSQIR